MGKTREAARKLTARSAANKANAPQDPPKPVVLTPEQQARLNAFKAMIKRQRDDWDALTPEQQREETDAWRRAMKRMNDDREGYRKLFLNDNFD